MDNGWGTSIADANIKNACDILKLEPITIKFDWNEYRDLQRSFFIAGVPNVDSPTDLAIYAALHQLARQYKIRYILNGHSFRTEGSSPISWSYFDPVYIKYELKKSSTYTMFNDFKLAPSNTAVFNMIRYGLFLPLPAGI